MITSFKLMYKIVSLNYKFISEGVMIMDNQGNKWTMIVKMLSEKNMTITTMESCTGGGVANAITSVSGASEVLKECVVTYCNEAKIRNGVSKDVIEKFTVYSPETAKSMAEAALTNVCADVSIGVTGQLGRIDPKNPVDKLNHVWFAIGVKGKKTDVTEVIAPNTNYRNIQKEFVICAIVDRLYEILKQQ